MTLLVSITSLAIGIAIGFAASRVQIGERKAASLASHGDAATLQHGALA